MKHREFCSYRLSLLGKQMVKQYIMQERRTVIRKLWTCVFVFILCAALVVIGFTETTTRLAQYSQYFTEFCVLLCIAAFMSVVIFFMLLHHNYRKRLSTYSDLSILKKGGFKIETIYVAGAYRPGKSGFGTTALRTLMEGTKPYVIGTITGNSYHAVNLTGDMIEGSYRPCVMLDNGSVYVLPRTAVTASQEQKKKK